MMAICQPIVFKLEENDIMPDVISIKWVCPRRVIKNWQIILYCLTKWNNCKKKLFQMVKFF